MASSALTTRGGRKARFSRDDIINILQRYHALYGPFTASAFSPSTAKWRDDPVAVERYYLGDPETGVPWPSLNTVKAAFDGSFNAALVAAGLPANRPGPASRRRVAGMARPIRDVSHMGATRTIVVEKDGDKTLERLARAEARANRLAGELERSRAAKRSLPKTRVVRERVPDAAGVERERRRAERAIAKAELEVLEARQATDVAKAQAKEAKVAATRAASKLERSEATIAALRAERREMKTEVEHEQDRAVAVQRSLDAARAEMDRMRAETRVVVRDAPEQAVVDAALAEAEAARQEAQRADTRAARAERQYMEIAAAATGQQRRLSKGELDALRGSGPVGPGVLAAALKDLAKAKNPTAKVAALTAIASAAVSWRERL